MKSLVCIAAALCLLLAGCSGTAPDGGTAAPAATVPVAVPGNDPVGPYYTPRDRHGNPINILPVKPKTSDACTQCGLCAQQCPLGAIDAEDAHQVPGKCMKCNRCVKHCPVGAKYFDDPAFLSHVAMLEQNFTEPKENEVYL